MSDEFEGPSRFLDVRENKPEGGAVLVNCDEKLALFKVGKEDVKPKTEECDEKIQDYKILPQIVVNSCETGIVRLTVNECKNLSDVMTLFESPQFEDNLKDSLVVSLITLNINDINTELDSNALFLVNNKYSKRSIVLSFASRKNKSFSLYWKSKEIQSFLIFNAYNDSHSEFDNALLKYVEAFLGDSLRKGHLGLSSYVNIKSEIKKVELHFLADSRGFNLLLLAAEKGDSIVVKILLKLGISTDSPYKDINAQSLAYKNRHYSILLLLLQSNLTYPPSIDINQCSDEIKDFHKLSCKLHELIIANNEEGVVKILDQNPQLRYFYNHKNESAAAIALRATLVGMYKILTAREVFFGPHEDTEDIMEKLEYGQRRELRELHHEHLQDLPEKHLNVLMSKSFIGHDVPDAKRKVGLLHSAYDALNGVLLIRILLMVVAASKKFQIIFDFNRDSVQLVDPTATSLTTGVFYLSGRIYIGAKQLLDKISESEALATIAHEFCHYAVNLTFNNDAKPYHKNDFQSMQEFEEISKHCQKHMHKEEVIELVYSCYSEETHHAELIVRVPHLMALYHNQLEKLKEVSQIFKPLFDFYEKRIVPEMEKALPSIEASAEKEMEEKDKKISTLIKIVVILIISAVVGIFLAGYIFHKPTYSFNTLSVQDQAKVKSTLVTYKATIVKFGDLYPKNSTIFDDLKSDDIEMILKGKRLDINGIHLNYLNGFIFHSWGNLTKNLKQKFLNSSFIFQNESVRFREFNGINSDILNSLTSKEIKGSLSGIELKVGLALENDTTFYVERSFEKSSSEMKEYIYNLETYDYDYEESTMTDLSEVTSNIQELDSLVNEQTTEAAGHSEAADNLQAYDYGSPNFHDHVSGIVDSDQAIDEARSAKLFVLSSEAGTGKTVVFKQLSLKIKKKFPLQWVSYIDLKNYTKFYNQNGSVEDVEELLKNILQLPSKSKFEKTLFEELYKSGNVTILWNGFDEISPLYSNYILNVVSSIQNKTGIAQYVCTRPLYRKQIEEKLNTSAYGLVPLNEKQQEEFLEKLFVIENKENGSNKEGLEEVKKIIEYLKGDSSESGRDFNSPLMLILVAQTYKKLDLNKTLNVYDMYEEFTKKKINIWLDKGVLVKDKNADFIKSKTNVIEFHQKYAIRSEISQTEDRDSIFMKVNKLNIMQKKFADLSYTDISQMGILFVNGEYEIDFSHRTFAEFFTVQYFIEKVYLEEESISTEEAELRVLLFYSMNRNFGRMKKEFMKDFLKKQKGKKSLGFSVEISEAFSKKFKEFLVNLIDREVFDYLLEFLSKDNEILLDLLHIDEKETFYTAIYDPNNFGHTVDVPRMKKLLRNYLKNEQFDKVVKGKYQRGKILSGVLFFRLLKSFYPDENVKVLESEEYTTELEMLGNLSYWQSFSMLKSFLSIKEQKELFKTASATRIYIYFHSAFNITAYKNLWSEFENLFTTDELKLLIGNAIETYLLVYKNVDLEECLTFLLEKSEKFLSDSQIHEMFTEFHILHEAANFYSYYDFVSLWEFYSNHSTKADHKKMLLDDYEGSKYSFQPPYFKIFHRALLSGVTDLFEYVDGIYKSIFITSEMRDIVLNPIDFLPYYIFKGGSVSVEFDHYLSELFKGNEGLLKKYLNSKIKGTKKNVFEFLENYPDDISSSIDKLSKLAS